MNQEHPQPTTFSELVCLFCYFDEHRQTRKFKKKELLENHTKIHEKEGDFDKRFHCGDPGCLEYIVGAMHYKSHASRVHDIWHLVERYY